MTTELSTAAHGSAPPAAQRGRHIARQARAVAEVLREHGVGSGDRVLVRSDNDPVLPAVVWALMHLDACIVAVDPGEGPERVREVLEVTRSALVVSDEGESVAGRPALAVGDLRAHAGADGPSGPAGLPDVSRWLDRRDALLMQSSGSTGTPRTVVKSGAALAANTEATVERMGYRDDDVLLPLLPLTHQYGLSLVFAALLHDLSLVALPTARLTTALEVVPKVGVTAVDASPPVYQELLSILERRPEVLASVAGVRLWCCGGAPLAQSIAKRFRSAVGLPLLDGYGGTEAGNVALAAPDNAVGCGRPLPGVELLVKDAHGNELGAGEVGEVLLRSGHLAEGYLEPSDGSLRPLRVPFATGDLGYLDGDGNLRVLGRRNAVHRNGHTLYPEALERKAERVGRRVRVLAVDHPRRGCSLTFVVEDPDGRSRSEWTAALRGVLSAHERPNRVRVIERFPTTPRGKVDDEHLYELVVDRPAEPGTAVGEAPFPERHEALERTLEYLRTEPEQVRNALLGIAHRRAVDYEIDAAIATLAGARGEIETYAPPRLERLAVLMPSNIALYAYILYLLVPSLYSREVRFRPSRAIAETTLRLHELLRPVHRLPVTACELSQRRFMEGPVADADALVFTGRFENAQRLRTRLRPEQVLVFFGSGTNPFVVTAEADLERAVADLSRIRLFNSGQDCLAPDLVLVHRSVQRPFVEALRERLDRARLGTHHDEEADYCPLVYGGALPTAVSHLLEWRDLIVVGGEVDISRGVVPPTVLQFESPWDIPLTEVFSPVFNVAPYDDEDELAERLSVDPYRERALGATVYGHAPQLVRALERHHTVSVDQTLLDVDDGNAPFGGRGQVANFISHQDGLWTEPLLLSKAMADRLGDADG